MLDWNEKFYAKALHVGSGKFESVEILGNRTIVMGGRNQTAVKGGEISVARVMYLSDGREEL
jgi:hypothetical protein